RSRDSAEAKAAALREKGAEAMALVADVFDRENLEAARGNVLEAWGRIDILSNAVGGHIARARTDVVPVFNLPFDAFDDVVRLNLDGTPYAALVFGKARGQEKRGSVVNIPAVASMQAISGGLGYSVAKAAIDNFTRWMAADLARQYGEGV